MRYCSKHLCMCTKNVNYREYIQGQSATSFVSPSQVARISGAHPGEESTPQGRWCPQTEQSTLSEPAWEREGWRGKEGVGWRWESKIFKQYPFDQRKFLIIWFTVVASFPGSHAQECEHWSCAGIESLVFILTWEALKGRREVDFNCAWAYETQNRKRNEGSRQLTTCI